MVDAMQLSPCLLAENFLADRHLVDKVYGLVSQSTDCQLAKCTRANHTLCQRNVFQLNVSWPNVSWQNVSRSVGF
jgi:hypothetical protein